MPRWIDFHDEDAALILGDMRTIPQGYWSVLRIFRHGEYSKYWNRYRQEAVCGSKYKYDDFTVRVLGKPGSGTSSQSAISGQGTGTILNAGMDDLDAKTFAILPEYPLSRYPVNGDILFEIDKYASPVQPLPPYVATDRYEITHLLKEHGDLGRSEIIYVVGKRIHGAS